MATPKSMGRQVSPTREMIRQQGCQSPQGGFSGLPMKIITPLRTSLMSWAAGDYRHVWFATISKVHKKRQYIYILIFLCVFLPGGKTDMPMINEIPLFHCYNNPPEELTP